MRVLSLILLGLILTDCAPTGGDGGTIAKAAQGDGAKAAQGDALIVKTSPYSVKETMDRLQAAVTKKGAHVFARVDHGAGAKVAGLPLAPAEVLIFGNPRLGTPLMQKNARFGLDLPVRVLVYQDGDTTKIVYASPQALGARYGLKANNPMLFTMGLMLDTVTKTAAKPR